MGSAAMDALKYGWSGLYGNSAAATSASGASGGDGSGARGERINTKDHQDLHHQLYRRIGQQPHLSRPGGQRPCHRKVHFLDAQPGGMGSAKGGAPHPP